MNRDELLSMLTLSIRPELEEPLVDWLLDRPEAPGFTSIEAAGHGTDPSHLSRVEQVTGRQRRRLFQIIAPFPVCNRLISDLAGDFGGADIFYWVTPIAGAGRLSSQAPGSGAD